MGITECYEYDDLVRLNDYLLKMNFNYRELLNVSNDIPYTLDIDFMSFQPSDIKNLFIILMKRINLLINHL